MSDYGLAQDLNEVDELRKNGINLNGAGTPAFMSLYTMFGEQCLPLDDMISFGYASMAVFHKVLPWMPLPSGTDIREEKKAFTEKVINI